MTVRSGDMSDLFKKPVGRSARQVSRGHARDRETITTMHDDKGRGLVMGDSVPYQLFFQQGDRCHRSVQRPSARTFLDALPALHDATPGCLDITSWMYTDTGTLRSMLRRQAYKHYWDATTRTAAGKHSCSDSAQVETSREAGPGTPEQKHSSVETRTDWPLVTSLPPRRDLAGPNEGSRVFVTEGGRQEEPHRWTKNGVKNRPSSYMYMFFPRVCTFAL